MFVNNLNNIQNSEKNDVQNGFDANKIASEILASNGGKKRKTKKTRKNKNKNKNKKTKGKR